MSHSALKGEMYLCLSSLQELLEEKKEFDLEMSFISVQ